MTTLPPPPPSATTAPAGASPVAHRSGAVARMLRMPVATLRVWERRYQLTQPALSAGGQRLYSDDDVRRLALVKRLTDLGHAIGSLASLDMPALERVAATHARTQAAADGRRSVAAADVPARATWRIAVVGAALADRLRRPALLRTIGRPVACVGPFDDVAQAAALQPGEVDLLLVDAAQLPPGWLAAVDADAPALAPVPKAVLYGFAADPECEALAAAGIALLRAPQPDAVLAQWLRGLSGRTQPTAPAHEPDSAGPQRVPARRWDDRALADFANHASTIACECPRHVADLLVQLSRFEVYSSACGNRNPADAQLHAFLQQTAAMSRDRFEQALEQIALHEGLGLPAPAPAEDAGA